MGWRVVEGLTALATLATLAGFLGRFSWWLELTCHFRLQYAWALLSSTAVFACGQRQELALASGCASALNFATIAPYYLPRRRSDAGVPIRIILANVYKNNRDHARLQRLLEDEAPDLVMLQEVNEPWLVALRRLQPMFPYGKALPRPDGFGMMLLSRWPLERAEVVRIGPIAVPSIVAQVRVHERLLRVLATHPFAPSGASRAALRIQQLRGVAEWVRCQPRPVMVLADLNLTSWSPWFRDLIHTAGLRDSRLGLGLQGSWPSMLPAPLRIPIDHCLVSPDIMVGGRRLGPNIGSDHLPVIIDCRLPGRSEATA